MNWILGLSPSYTCHMGNMHESVWVVGNKLGKFDDPNRHIGGWFLCFWKIGIDQILVLSIEGSVLTPSLNFGSKWSSFDRPFTSYSPKDTRTCEHNLIWLDSKNYYQCVTLVKMKGLTKFGFVLVTFGHPLEASCYLKAPTTHEHNLMVVELG